MNNDDRDKEISTTRALAQTNNTQLTLIVSELSIIVESLKEIKKTLSHPLTGVQNRLKEVEDKLSFHIQEHNREDRRVERSETVWYTKVQNLIAVGALIVAIIALWKS
jgi:hypothetical protein